MIGRTLRLAAVAALCGCAPAHAGMDGLEVQAGALAYAPGGVRADRRPSFAERTGWRGLARVGLGSLSAGVESQSAWFADESQPRARYTGIFAAWHPLSLAGVTPYVDVGAGRLSQTDAQARSGERAAWTYGCGAEFHPAGHWGINLGVHVLREGSIAPLRIGVTGVPAVVSGLLGYRF